MRNSPPIIRDIIVLPINQPMGPNFTSKSMLIFTHDRPASTGSTLRVAMALLRGSENSES